MYHNYDFDDVNEALPRLLLDLEKRGEEVGSRAGRTKELTHVGITLRKPWRREILLDHRKPNIAAQIAETVWVLAGHNDIGWLGHYLPRAKDFSDDGMTWRAGYGKRLRAWPVRNGDPHDVIDQIRFVYELLSRDRTSRQAVASIWDPKIDTQPGKDIPCNDWLNFSSRLGQLDLHVALRSNDVIWGWSGINQFEWSVLLEVMAGLLGVEVGSLHFSTTSFHIYEHHWAKGHKIAESAFCSWPAPPAAESPRFDATMLPTRDVEGLDEALTYWLELEKRIRNGDPAELDVDEFPEPMLRSWLRVLQWWWTGDRDYVSGLEGTALERATHFSVQPSPIRLAKAAEESVARTTLVLTEQGGHTREIDITAQMQEKAAEFNASAFIRFAVATHIEKDAAYGTSWKRRGELLAILPNIARKVDRLGGAETSDETSADTAMDLMVYLAKYLVWLEMHSHGEPHDFDASDFPDEANQILFRVDATHQGEKPLDRKTLESRLRDDFEALTKLAEEKRERISLACDMLDDAYRLARQLWDAEQEEQQQHLAMEGKDEYRGADVD